MKKFLLLTAVTVFGAATLVGCNAEKAYNYADFKNVVEKNNPTFTSTKAVRSAEEDGKKLDEVDYTWDATKKVWTYEEYEDFDGEMILTNGYANLDIKFYVKNIEQELTFAGLTGKADDYYKFYAGGSNYRMSFAIDLKEQKYEGEYKFNKEGLLTYSHAKTTEIASKKVINERTETYKYSK